MGNLSAGRELDALVAEKVMGQGFIFYNNFQEKNGNKSPLPDNVAPYSTSIAAVWEVVEQLRTKGFWFLIEQERPDINSEWVAAFTNFEANADGSERADTAPLAICLAALKAVGVEHG